MNQVPSIVDRIIIVDAKQRLGTRGDWGKGCPPESLGEFAAGKCSGGDPVAERRGYIVAESLRDSVTSARTQTATGAIIYPGVSLTPGFAGERFGVRGGRLTSARKLTCALTPPSAVLSRRAGEGFRATPNERLHPTAT